MTTALKPPPAGAGSYAAAYAELAAIAERLRAGGSAAAIDTLAEDVRAARRAYDTCRARLEAIRREVDIEAAAVHGAEATS